MTQNLKEILIPTDSGNGESLKDFGIQSTDGTIKLYFRDLQQHLIAAIESAEIVVGCVAWVTSAAIINALARKSGVSIIVQKEDFLRPDLDASKDHPAKLKQLYDTLPSGLSRSDQGFSNTQLADMSFAGDPAIQSVRCVGNYNGQANLSSPRAHHKFIVPCRRAVTGNHGDFEPYAVWTGSYNFTSNSDLSFENAMIISDPKIFEAYLSEYAQLASISEPLDWESPWVAPEWGIGS